jgi:urease accessory protein
MAEARIFVRVKGHLHLVCAAREHGGGNYLRSQSFRAPFHLSKPHEDAGALVVNMVNPTAGIFDDDEIELEATVESNANLVLTTPSSNRVYRSRNGSYATVKQILRVEANASLEYYPEPFIPHSGARFRQQNDLHVASGGVLLYFEWLSPGRVAKGESFAYEELCWDTDLWLDQKLIGRERYALSPKDSSLASLRWHSSETHYLGCFAIGIEEFPQESIERLGGEGVYLGCGPLCAGGWTIKALCRDALSARRKMKDLRTVLYQSLGRPAPALGRL